jgi:hypothetical protein
VSPAGGCDECEDSHVVLPLVVDVRVQTRTDVDITDGFAGEAGQVARLVHHLAEQGPG